MGALPAVAALSMCMGIGLKCTSMYLATPKLQELKAVQVLTETFPDISKIQKITLSTKIPIGIHFAHSRDVVRFSNPGGQAVMWWA